MFVCRQAIGEELEAQQERLERNRSAAVDLGKSLAMSPVAVAGSGSDPLSPGALMPVGLVTSADHVARQLEILQQSISLMADMVEKESSALSNCNGTIMSAEKLIDTARQVLRSARSTAACTAIMMRFLLLQTLCTVEEDPDGERIEDQLVVLRDQLLQLSPTEQQLNSAPAEQFAVSVDVRPRPAISPATSASIQATLQVIKRLLATSSRCYNCVDVSLLQQWESIFQKTFAEYERLLNKLQDRCDEAATAQVWREHLDQAEKYLSRSLPDQYQSTCEDRDLCKVLITRGAHTQRALFLCSITDALFDQLHESLLLRHRSVFQSAKDETDQVPCSLHTLHAGLLTRIRQRHGALCDRAAAWEQYRTALSKLLTWLDAAERERKNLVLRQVQEHGLPTALHRVEVLLDKLGQGQRVQGDVERCARQLLETLGGEDESASAVRADIKSAAARLTDLDAGLSTWRDFLQRVARLYQNLEKGVEAIRLKLHTVQQDLVADNELPAAPAEAADLLQCYRVRLLFCSKHVWS